jgi:3-hydroxybutyryl-CoA dehydrogenase
VAALAGCQVVVESVVEDLTAKQQVLAAVEGAVGPRAVLATNTSSLSVTAVAGALAEPGRALGLHFFNPAPRMPLVEVVRGDETAAHVVETACELVRSWGKTPVVAASTPGFIVNRVARPFYGEAHRLLEEGVGDPATLDAVLREAGGFPMGPFELADLVGQDVNLAVARSVWEQTFGDPRYAPTVLQRRLVDAGRLGRKSGRGVYRYADGVAVDAAPSTEPPREPPAVLDVVVWDRDEDAFPVMQPFLDRCAAGGVRLRTVVADPDTTDDVVSRGVQLPGGGVLVEVDHGDWSGLGGTVELDWAHDPAGCRRVALLASPDCPAESVETAVGLCQAAGAAVSVLPATVGGVVARTVAMLVNEAVELVTRGEADAEDVDVAMVLGTGYPSGPLGWGDAVGADRVASLLQQLADAHPSGRYRPGPALGRSLVAGTHLRDL